MRENRLSGLEGGVADNGHPYPYVGKHGWDLSVSLTFQVEAEKF